MCMSEVELPGRLSTAVPSPQFTVMPVTGTVLDAVNVMVTVWPVAVGLGVGLLTLTVGGETGVWTVTDPVPWPVEPLLSTAVTVIVNVLAEP